MRGLDILPVTRMEGWAGSVVPKGNPVGVAWQREQQMLAEKFRQVLIHFCAKDHYRLCHTVHRLIHSLEFQAHTQCDPTSLYLSMFCLVHVFSGFSTVRK